MDTLLKNRRLMVHLRDGMMALAPLHVVLGIGAIGGLLVSLPTFVFWFLGRCVFQDIKGDRFTPLDPALFECHPFPELTISTWITVFVSLAVLGIVYSLLYRYGIRYRWEKPLLDDVLHAADGFGVLIGPLVATAWSQHVQSIDGAVSSFAKMIILFSPVIMMLWWRSCATVAARLIARRAEPSFVASITIQVLLVRHFALSFLSDVHIVCRDSELTIEGPFDAVDAVRIDDLLDTVYPTPVYVELKTTLSEEDYWRPYEEDLTPSGYVSPPIQERTLSSVAVYTVMGVCIIVATYGLGQGVHFGMRNDAFKTFLGMTAGRVPGIDSVALNIIDSNENYEPFKIDVAGSYDACPMLARNALRRWRLATETRVFGQNRNNVVRIHELDLKYYVFVIDRETHRCTEELELSTLTAAQTTGRRYTIGSGWEVIPLHYDWRHVPPVAR